MSAGLAPKMNTDEMEKPHLISLLAPELSILPPRPWAPPCRAEVLEKEILAEK